MQNSKLLSSLFFNLILFIFHLTYAKVKKKKQHNMVLHDTILMKGKATDREITSTWRAKQCMKKSISAHI